MVINHLPARVNSFRLECRFGSGFGSRVWLLVRVSHHMHVLIAVSSTNTLSLFKLRILLALYSSIDHITSSHLIRSSFPPGYEPGVSSSAEHTFCTGERMVYTFLSYIQADSNNE
jgi:hypothetical protein